MPDATKQRDPTPDVTANNQDVPGQMNQPPAFGGVAGFPPGPGEVVGSTVPSSTDTDELEEVSGHLMTEAGEYMPGTAPDDLAGFHSEFPGDAPVAPDTAELHDVTRGRPQFKTANADAVATFTRAAHDWDSGARTVSANNPIMVVGRQRGRTSTVIWVPTKDANGATPNGVVFGSTEGELQGAGYPALLNVGDSAEIDSEGAVWVGVIGANATGLVCFLTNYNPAGGELGNF